MFSTAAIPIYIPTSNVRGFPFLHTLWYLEKWHRQNYLQGRNRDADRENGLANATGEGEGGRTGRAASTYTQYPEHRQRGGSCYVAPGALVGALSPTWRGGVRGGRRAQGTGDACKYVTDSPCCVAGTNTTL